MVVVLDDDGFNVDGGVSVVVVGLFLDDDWGLRASRLGARWWSWRTAIRVMTTWGRGRAIPERSQKTNGDGFPEKELASGAR